MEYFPIHEWLEFIVGVSKLLHTWSIWDRIFARSTGKHKDFLSMLSEFAVNGTRQDRLI